MSNYYIKLTGFFSIQIPQIPYAAVPRRHLAGMSMSMGDLLSFSRWGIRRWRGRQTTIFSFYFA